MKKLFLIIVCLIVLFDVFAVPAEIKDSFSGKSCIGNFKQTKSVVSGKRLFVSTGKVQISPGLGIVWFTEKPYESKLIVCNNKLIQQIRNNKPVQLSIAENPVYTSVASVIEAVFTGNVEIIEKNFDVSYSIDDKWVIELEPKDKIISSFIQHITMTGSDRLETLKVIQNSSDSVTYEFYDMVEKELSDEEKEIYKQ